MGPEVHPLRLTDEYVDEKISGNTPENDPALLYFMEKGNLRREYIEKDAVQDKNRYPSDRIDEYPQNIISFTSI
jgi:hypothetical protein